jgi:hypothetical protein
MNTKMSDLYAEVATAHNIHPMEATDEVQDAIEILFAREDRPTDTVVDYERVAILEYIADQYRTNRTRL